MIISFNNHYPDPVDHEWGGFLPMEPAKCFDLVHDWMARLRLPLNRQHSIVMPGVRGAIILSTYIKLFNHFPILLYSFKDRYGVWTWEPIDIHDCIKGFRYLPIGLKEKSKGGRS